MGVGGAAAVFAVAETAEALERLMAVVVGEGLAWHVLGGGANTIFRDAGFPGVVIKPGRGLRRMERGPAEHQVTAGAAAPLSAVMNFAKRSGLAGLEWAAGIPGTFGGAIAGNAGTAEGYACDFVDAAVVLDRQGRRTVRRRGEFAYGYRWSALREEIILEATLGLIPDDPAAITERIKACLATRKGQPYRSSCSGCIFKNPEGDSAGRLIDAAGLKGLRVGGASISAGHANFIVNDEGATAADIETLIERVRRAVHDRFGKDLDLEVRIV
jgi:UDP-N-acetylmuramate dehydrogenase